MSHSTRILLADLVLYAHFAFVLFILGGLVAIYVFGFLHRPFIRNRAFRIAHVSAIAFVTFEALFSITCPLTRIEGELREEWLVDGENRTFMSRWIENLLYIHDPPPWLLPSAYCAVLLFSLAAWRRFPPVARRSRKTPDADSSRRDDVVIR
jgi:hypothetical protein